MTTAILKPDCTHPDGKKKGKITLIALSNKSRYSCFAYKQNPDKTRSSNVLFIDPYQDNSIRVP